MKKILVLGGGGFVGRNVCETRRAANAQAVQPLPMLDVVEADLHNETTLASLVAGHDAVVNLVAILHGSQAQFERVHVELVQKLARACTAAGVARIVHISALGAAADAPSMYQRSKAAGEAVLAASGLDATILRPSVIFGAGDHFLNLFARLQGIFPVMPLAGADTRFQPVWVEDVAEAVVRCLQMDSNQVPVYEGFGPEVFTLRELVQLAGRLSGHPRPVLGLPAALARIQALAMELAPGEPLMSRDNLDSMRVDNVASGTLPGLAALGITPSALSAIASGYLGFVGPRSSLLGLRQTAGR